MKTRTSRGALFAASALTAAALCLGPAGAFAAGTAPLAPTTVSVAVAVQPGTPSAVLASTPWETTSAVDQNGNPVALDDPRAANFVGWAYFKQDGTYTMYNLDDSPKLRGEWTVNAAGTERWINAVDADGKVLFERTVDIVTLTDAEFTYRVYAEGSTTEYVNIVHTPTDHAEPVAMTPSQVLASTPWETTASVDQNGNPVTLDDPRAANFVGWAYFNEDGTYTMYNLDDSPKLRGEWTVAADGSTRWINAVDADGKVLFERTVDIVTLTDAEFTYRVYAEGSTTEWVDIIHTPTDHVEPVAADDDAAAEATPGETPAAQDPALAETGSEAPLMAFITAIVALVGGAGAFVVSKLRRRQSAN